MSPTAANSDTTEMSFWRKSLGWIREFEEALEFNPTQASIDQLNRQVTELKGVVRNLETKLDTHDVERS